MDYRVQTTAQADDGVMTADETPVRARAGTRTAPRLGDGRVGERSALEESE
jgi:hypothetical protein